MQHVCQIFLTHLAATLTAATLTAATLTAATLIATTLLNARLSGAGTAATAAATTRRNRVKKRLEIRLVLCKRFKPGEDVDIVGGRYFGEDFVVRNIVKEEDAICQVICG